MKVLSGHVVTKSQVEESMDLFIMAPSAVHVNSGPSPFQPTSESYLVSGSHADNINRRRWRRLFRRVQKKNMDCDSAPSPQKKMLFGRALSDVCERDGSPPKHIMDILSVLWRKGPYTIGLFRKAGNAKRLKEIKEQLNSGAEVDLKDEPVILLADLLKDFLRHLPGSLLMVEKYKAWMAAMERQDVHDRCSELQTVVNKLPEPNIQLLKHLMAVLYHISLKEEINKMDSSNLAVCVSPNLLQTDRVEMVEMVKNVSNLTQFLIENCCEIFGEEVLTLLGDLDEEELSDNQDSVHHDSAYDSNDPDADVYKESFAETHSDAEDKTLNHFEASSCPGAVGRNTAKPFTRRRSEPTIGFNEGARKQISLTRSQTEMDFYEHHLTKQISDECVLFRRGSRLSDAQRNTRASGESRLQSKESKDSCSSLESTFSSASESSIHTSSPIIPSSTQRRALLRKQSFPTRLSAHGSETTKKRSQSMKASSSRTKTSFSQGGSKRVEKALRHSQTLPEVLDRTFLALQTTRCSSSEAVFLRVDSRIPSKPPSYEQAIQDNTHSPLAHRGSLTVEAARCLSKNTCCQSTFPTVETSDSSSVRNCSDDEQKSPTLAGSGTTVSHCCGQQMLETVNVRESYV